MNIGKVTMATAPNQNVPQQCAFVLIRVLSPARGVTTICMKFHVLGNTNNMSYYITEIVETLPTHIHRKINGNSLVLGINGADIAQVNWLTCYSDRGYVAICAESKYASYEEGGTWITGRAGEFKWIPFALLSNCMHRLAAFEHHLLNESPEIV